ncbi:glutaredoxin family protein [bacterium]|nr:glutaredoxin family protein [bacterium]
MDIKHIEGEKKSKILLYALSTCGWCRKTKTILNELGIEYYYIDVDLLSPDEKDKVTEEVKKYNPACTFPTIVINDGERSIRGFKEDEIRQLADR